EHNFASARPADGSSALSRGGELVHGHFFGQSSFATHAVANERNVVRLSGSMPLEIAAPLGCGIQTGAGAILNTLGVPAGATVAGVAEGDSVRQVFLPQLVRFWEQGRFPVERLMTHYDFDRIEDAVRAAESGDAIKPVLRMS